MKILTFTLTAIFLRSFSFAGDLCIRPTQETAHTGPNMTQQKQSRSNCSQHLLIQVDDLNPVDISPKDGAWVRDLLDSKSHTVKVLKDNTVINSFKFKFKDKSWPKMTLWRKAGYCSWHILPRGRKYPECPWPKKKSIDLNSIKGEWQFDYALVNDRKLKLKDLIASKKILKSSASSEDGNLFKWAQVQSCEPIAVASHIYFANELSIAANSFRYNPITDPSLVEIKRSGKVTLGTGMKWRHGSFDATVRRVDGDQLSFKFSLEKIPECSVTIYYDKISYKKI